jgi:hypothetical protein
VAVSPAGAIAPPEPATCSFSFGPVSTSGALGSLGLQWTVIPAVATQQCTAVASVTTTIAYAAGGALAGGVSDNPLTQTVTLHFSPALEDPSVSVFWNGDCTTTGAPTELITRSGALSAVSALGAQSTCASKGTGVSTLQVIDVDTISGVGIAPTLGDTGYRLLSNGMISDLRTLGTPELPPNDLDTLEVVPTPQIAITQLPNGNGDWTVSAGGLVVGWGYATFHGDVSGIHINAPIVGIAADRATGGYWLVGADGGVYSFDAPFHGSMGGMHLNSPIVGIAATPDGGGYWLVAADGGVFSFGDAAFWGSAGSIRLNSPVVGMAADPATGGYWLVAADGGVFTYHAPFFGSEGGHRLNAGISGMASTTNGQGYWLVGADGGVFTFGNAPFYGT